MFDNQKFLTRGVENEIPSWLINLMWHMVLTMEVPRKDYLQVFILTKTPTGQHIVHEREGVRHRRFDAFYYAACRRVLSFTKRNGGTDNERNENLCKLRCRIPN